MKKNNTWLVLSGAGLVVLIILLIILKKTNVIGNGSSLEVEMEKVQRRTIIETISASGKLKPEKEVSISADVSGEIIELNVKEGDKVKKGDLLCRIKPDEYKSMLEESEAAYKSSISGLDNSKATLEQAKALLDKNKVLYERYLLLKEKNAVSSAEFERVEAEYITAKAQYESAQQGISISKYNINSAAARKNKALENLRKTTIYAPMDGIVSQLNNELGERVVGTAQMQGTVIMKIADMSQMLVLVDVNENDIIRISKGDTAAIEIDAFRDDKFKGIVTEIANSSKESTTSLTEQVTSYEVKIRILESSYKHLIDSSRNVSTPFRPGMSAMVDINTNIAVNVVSSPVLSVTKRSEKESSGFQPKKKKKKDTSDENDEKSTIKENEGKEVVFVVVNGKVKKTIVTTGIQDYYYMEIKSGLKEGDMVVSGPYNLVSKMLKDGQSVRKKTAGSKD